MCCKQDCEWQAAESVGNPLFRTAEKSPCCSFLCAELACCFCTISAQLPRNKTATMALPSALATGGSCCLFLFFFVHAVLPSGCLRHVKSAPAEWWWFCFFGRFALTTVLCFALTSTMASLSPFNVTRRRRQWDPGTTKHSNNGRSQPRVCRRLTSSGNSGEVFPSSKIPTMAPSFAPAMSPTGMPKHSRSKRRHNNEVLTFHCCHPVLSRPAVPNIDSQQQATIQHLRRPVELCDGAFRDDQDEHAFF